MPFLSDLATGVGQEGCVWIHLLEGLYEPVAILAAGRTNLSPGETSGSSSLANRSRLGSRRDKTVVPRRAEALPRTEPRTAALASSRRAARCGRQLTREACGRSTEPHNPARLCESVLLNLA